MSTRANVRISKGLHTFGNYDEKIKWLYRHCDGYPEGLGNDIENIFQSFESGIDAKTAASKIIEEADCEETSFMHGDIEYLYDIDLDHMILYFWKVDDDVATFLKRVFHKNCL